MTTEEAKSRSSRTSAGVELEPTKPIPCYSNPRPQYIVSDTLPIQISSHISRMISSAPPGLGSQYYWIVMSLQGPKTGFSK